MNDAASPNTKLDLLRKRENDLRAQIAAEVRRQQKRQVREFARLRTILGAAVLEVAEQSPQFKEALCQNLSAADLPTSDRAFLKSKGWQ